jgi:hypothetical protein
MRGDFFGFFGAQKKAQITQKGLAARECHFGRSGDLHDLAVTERRNLVSQLENGD